MGARTKQITLVSSEILSDGKSVVTQHGDTLNNRETEDNVILIATQQHRYIRSGIKAAYDVYKGTDIYIPSTGGPTVSMTPPTVVTIPADVGVNSKMIFVMQGLRKVMMNKELRWTVLLCKEGYTEKQISKITSTFKNIKDENGKAVVNDLILIEKDANQIVDYLNDLKIKGQPVLKDKASSRSEFKVKRLYVYAHGIVGSFQLWMKLKSATEQFGIPEANKLKSEAFSSDARIVSQACRTGIGNPEINSSVYYEVKISTGVFSSRTEKRRYDEMFSESLAQKLADSTKAQVNAFTRRSDYEDTFNTPDELDFLDACKAYFSKNKPERAANKEKQGVYAHILKNGPTSPEEKERYDFLIKRDKQRYLIDDYRFDPLGALHPVKPGTTPEGLSKKLETFLPLKKA